MNSNCIGVWMDFSHAIFIDPSSDTSHFEILESLHSAHTREDAAGDNKTHLGSSWPSNNEKSTHNKEQVDQKHYFKLMKDRLKGYDEIFLFGPTDASRLLKAELDADALFQRRNLVGRKPIK